MHEDLAPNVFGVSHHVQQTNGGSRRTWSISEFDGKGRVCGLACGCEDERGWSALAELVRVRGPATSEEVPPTELGPLTWAAVRGPGRGSSRLSASWRQSSFCAFPRPGPGWCPLRSRRACGQAGAVPCPCGST